MGCSAVVENFVTHPENIYVGWDGDDTWWVLLHGKSYGGSYSRLKAIQIALDVSAGLRRFQPIIVLKKDGTTNRIITRTAQHGNRPSSQLFQDNGDDE